MPIQDDAERLAQVADLVPTPMVAEIDVRLTTVLGAIAEALGQNSSGLTYLGGIVEAIRRTNDEVGRAMADLKEKIKDSAQYHQRG